LPLDLPIGHTQPPGCIPAGESTPCSVGFRPEELINCGPSETACEQEPDYNIVSFCSDYPERWKLTGR
jgi:hypothetical protein